jgi:hypothetical protein
VCSAETGGESGYSNILAYNYTPSVVERSGMATIQSNNTSVRIFLDGAGAECPFVFTMTGNYQTQYGYVGTWSSGIVTINQGSKIATFSAKDEYNNDLSLTIGNYITSVDTSISSQCNGGVNLTIISNN